MHVSLQRWFPVLLVFALAASSTVANADHQLPHAMEIAVDPNDPDRIALRLSHFGILVSEDGGDRWVFICDKFLGLLGTWRTDLRHTRDGGLLIGGLSGLQHAEATGCGWTWPTSDLRDVVVADLRRHPEAEATFFAVTAQGGAMNGVYRSDDDGKTWSPVGPQVEGFLRDIHIASSRPSRVYVTRSSQVGESHEHVLRVSDDDGETWVERDVPAVKDREAFHLVHVDPADADRVLGVVASTATVPAPGHTDRIFLSEDAGATWRQVAEVMNFTAAAATPDGANVWIGDRDQGLWRSEDRGGSFERMHRELDGKYGLQVYGLRYAHGVLWVGADRVRNGFGLGASEDGGETIRRVSDWQGIESLASCSGIESQCERSWMELQRKTSGEHWPGPTLVDLGDPPVWPPRDASREDAGMPPQEDAGMPPQEDAGMPPQKTAIDAGDGADAVLADGAAAEPPTSGSHACQVSGALEPTPWATLGWMAVAITALGVRRRRAAVVVGSG